MSLVVKGPRDIVAVYHFPKTSGELVRETLRRINQLTVKDSPCREEFSRHCAVESWKGEVPKVGFTLVREAVGVEKSADDLRVMVPPQNVSQQLETKWRRGQKPRFRAATKKAKAIYEKAK